LKIKRPLSCVGSLYFSGPSKSWSRGITAVFSLLFITLFLPMGRASAGSASTGTANAPRLFFSDIESGPKTGWEGSHKKGAAVTVWGLGFGAARSSSYITVNNARLSKAADYAEWGAIGPARGLERITFWLNNSVADGPGRITVTVKGAMSNALPFTVRAGHIYFISPSGSNRNNGRYSSTHGWHRGPWADFYKANFYSNHRLDDGDIVYVRSGTYTAIEEENFAMHIRDRSCTASLPCAVVGYPGEAMPVVDTPRTEIYQEFDRGYRTDYWTMAKIKFQNGIDAFHISGDGWRVVGCAFEGYKADAWTGIISPAASDNGRYLGLLFKDSGYDYYKHAIYPTCQNGGSEDRPITFIEIGWNEVDNWIGDLGAPRHLGGAAFNFRANSSTNIISGVYIHDNYMHDSPSGQFYYNEEAADNIYIYNNLLVNTDQRGARTAKFNLQLEAVGGVRHFYIFNNTFYNSSSSKGDTYIIGARGHIGSQAVVSSKNNIYYNIRPDTSYFYNNGYGGSIINSHNDLFYGSGEPESYPGNKYYNYTSAITGHDPLFVNAPAYNLRLKKGSPAIDRGVNSREITDLVDADYLGLQRPLSKAYDIGAYEYNE